MPAVNPVTVIGDAPVPVNPPGDEVAVNVVDPVPADPAVYVTVTFQVVFTFVAVPIVGAPGFKPTVTEFDAPEEDDVPYAFDALTVNV